MKSFGSLFKSGPPLRRELIIKSLYNIVDLPGDKTLVEIGTFHGDTAYACVNILEELKCPSKFYSVDVNNEYWDPINKLGGWTPKGKWHEAFKGMETKYCHPSFIEGDSKLAIDIFDRISWCFVDGCHCYDCALSDINLYGKKIVSGGIMLIDDTTPWDKQKTQWYHDKNDLRYQDVVGAIRDSEVLKENFTMLEEFKAHHGMQMWKKN